MAGYDTRLNKIETDSAGVKGELSLLKWMVGFNLALSVAILLKLFLH